MPDRTDAACPDREFPVSTCDSTEVRAHLRRIMDSPHFVHAHQLQHFLEHLVESTLDGRADDLKEYSLGRDVFRRGESYDPRNDAIVRVLASILRKRLTAYYENGGSADRLRIDLPKGSYVPQFLSPEGVPCPGQADSLPAETQPPALKPSRRRLLELGGAILAGAAGVGGFWALSRSRDNRVALKTDAATFPARKLSPRIWAPLLDGKKPIQLAFGCPQFFRGGGLYIRDVNVNNLEESANARLQELTRQLGQYLTPSPNTYTGVGEIMGIYRMTQFVTHQGMDSSLENVQLLTPGLIRNKHLILVSSYRFRTLIDLLALPRAFTADYGGSGSIVLRENRAEEKARYSPVSSGGVSRSYGLISYWTQPETGGRILLMSGIESWATLGTVEFITGEQNLRDLEARLGVDFNDQSKGLEVLVEIQGHEDRPISVRYVTHRVLA